MDYLSQCFNNIFSVHPWDEGYTLNIAILESGWYRAMYVNAGGRVLYHADAPSASGAIAKLSELF